MMRTHTLRRDNSSSRPRTAAAAGACEMEGEQAARRKDEWSRWSIGGRIYDGSVFPLHVCHAPREAKSVRWVRVSERRWCESRARIE